MSSFLLRITLGDCAECVNIWPSAITKATLSRKLLSLHLDDSGYLRFKNVGIEIEGGGGEPRRRREKEEEEGRGRGGRR
jgi:hypothetical protein